MRRSFQQQIVVKDLSQFNMVYLVPLADWHIGDRNTAIDVIQGYIEWIRERDNAFTILNGDLMNAAWKESSAELYDDLITPDQTYTQVRELCEPIKDKILMITRGNHEEAIYRKVGADYSARLAYDLGDIPYKPDGGMLGMRLCVHTHTGMCFTYVTHGWGGARTIGAKVKKAQDLMSVAEAHIYVLSHDHCFSSDTELLTLGGWKSYLELSEKDEALTFAQDTGELVYQKIEAVYTYDDFKELLHFAGRSIDLLVTTEHTLLYKRVGTTSKWLRNSAKNIAEIPSSLSFPQAGRYVAEGVELDDDIIKLTAWIISEGHFHEDNAGVRISQLEGKHRDIQQILDNLGISYRLVWTETTRGKAYAIFNIHAKDGIWIRTIVDGKHIPYSFKELDDRQFEIFLDELVKGDGYRNAYNRAYTTANHILAGQLQELGVKHGYRVTDTTRGNMHNIYFSSHLECSLPHGSKATLVPYSGVVWCVTVPNHTVIVRRNGRVVITGNTQNINRGNVLEPPKNLIRSNRPAYMVTRRKLFINTGGFIRYGGYIQRKGLTPQDIGTPRIRIELKRSTGNQYIDLHASI